jgi:hypothetical protein
MTDQACGCEADSGDPDYSCDCLNGNFQFYFLFLVYSSS